MNGDLEDEGSLARSRRQIVPHTDIRDGHLDGVLRILSVTRAIPIVAVRTTSPASCFAVGAGEPLGDLITRAAVVARHGEPRSASRRTTVPIFNRRLLMLVDPASENGEEELPWL